MSQTVFDLADARRLMVDGQIRPNRISDPRVLEAMRRLPRERFVPEPLALRAYVDEDLPLGDGRVLMEPLVIARLVQSARPVAGERGLVVGSGTGYGAALLAACGVAVTGIEDDPRLLAIARAVLGDVAPGVTLIEGSIGAGVPAGAPYDIILIEGAVRHIPDALAAQLRAGTGRITAVVTPEGGTGQVVIAQRVGGDLGRQPLYDAASPLLPSLLPTPRFVF